MVDPFLLDALQSFLVTLERRLDRLKQRLQLGLALLVSSRKALASLLEEILVGFLEQLIADGAELRDQRVARFRQILHALIEVASVRLERGKLARGCVASRARLVPFLEDTVELETQRFNGLPGGGRIAARDQPADQDSHERSHSGDEHHDADIH
ncbi:MAG TPA: hypothetical protein VM265_10005 [Sphingomicrobium sp.]|nr:hypothetical protein [Sphingomicrobium sp.]